MSNEERLTAPLMVSRRVAADGAMQSVGHRLAEEHEAVRLAEARAKAARKRRALLAEKLRVGGITTREIARVTGDPKVSSAHVVSWRAGL